MKAEIIDGKLTINIYDLLNTLDDDKRMELIDALSCMENVISFVCEQIVDGFTPLCSQGQCDRSGSNVLRDCQSALEQARSRIANNAGRVAQDTIRELMLSCECYAKTSKEYSDSYFTLYHAWPKGFAMPEGHFPNHRSDNGLRFKCIEVTKGESI